MNTHLNHLQQKLDLHHFIGDLHRAPRQTAASGETAVTVVCLGVQSDYVVSAIILMFISQKRSKIEPRYFTTQDHNIHKLILSVVVLRFACRAASLSVTGV